MKTKGTSHLRSRVSGFAHSVKKLGIIGVFTAVASFGAISVRADDFAYANLAAGAFGTLDLNTGNFNYLGGSSPALSGLAVLNGTFYAFEDATVNGTSGTNLFTVDPTTGNSTFVGFSDVVPLAFGSTMSGLYAVNAGGGLYAINPSTGASSLIGPTGVPSTDFDTLDALSTDASTLYFAGGPNFYELNTTTGAATLLAGNIPILDTVALAMVDGVLYGAVENSPPFYIYSINPITGGLTAGPIISTPFGTVGISGLAPVPEPSTWSMIGAGGIGLLGMMARRRRSG